MKTSEQKAFDRLWNVIRAMVAGLCAELFIIGVVDALEQAHAWGHHSLSSAALLYISAYAVVGLITYNIGRR